MLRKMYIEGALMSKSCNIALTDQANQAILADICPFQSILLTCTPLKMTATYGGCNTTYSSNCLNIFARELIK